MQTSGNAISIPFRKESNRHRKPVNWLTISCVLVCALMSLPVLMVLVPLLKPDLEAFRLLWETRLPTLLWNTFRLSLGVGLGTFALGTTLAWIVVMYEFPGKRFFEWSLLLPLSMPGYVIGFVYISSFEYEGVIPSLLEMLPGVSAWYPDISGAAWVTIVMVFVLYPYVYLMSRTAFRDQQQSLGEAARSLGITRNRLFLKVAIPVARPSILAGVSLAVMESMADFGTVGVFSYDTFTTAIYEVWFGLFDRRIATQLAGMLLLFVLLVLWFEKSMKRKSRYYQLRGSSQPVVPRKPVLFVRILMMLYPSLVLMFSFGYPASILVYWSISSIEAGISAELIRSVINTLTMGVVAGILVVAISILLGYGKRLEPGRILNTMTGLATIGYAVPGSVIAVGVLIPLAFLDRSLSNLLQSIFGISAGLILTGSIFGILLAYIIRFITVGFGAVNTNLERISPSLDMAARSLGKTKFGVIRSVHLTLLKPGMMTGFILVCIEVMKEMPATLLMRPFGFETLATRIWQLTSESLVEEAALPSLMIVVTGLVPVLFLTHFSRKTRANELSRSHNA